MTKKFIYAVAALAIMLVSCSQKEEEVHITPSNEISLNPTTALATRATVVNLTTLTKDETGFVVYGTSGDDPDGWYFDAAANGGAGAGIDGTNNHSHKTGKWSFDEPLSWPTEVEDYPMHFYAFYPQAPNTVITSVEEDFPDVTLNITIPVEVENQLDILASYRATSTKPATSSLGMTFRHILSKINFVVSNQDESGEIIPAEEQTAYVMAVGFKNLYSTNTFDLMSQSWGYILEDLDEFNYFNEFVPRNDKYDIMSFSGAEKEPFYTEEEAVDKHLMLLPQGPQVWNPSPSPGIQYNLPDDHEAYVRVWYRLEITGNPDYIGYESATRHPGYEGSQLEEDGYDGPLFVLAGYTYEGVWSPGKGYVYNIPIPSSGGGRLIDKNLYDDGGNRTDLELPGGEEGNHIISSDNTIRLIPTVNEWDDGEEDLNDDHKIPPT